LFTTLGEKTYVNESNLLLLNIIESGLKIQEINIRCDVVHGKYTERVESFMSLLDTVQVTCNPMFSGSIFVFRAGHLLVFRSVSEGCESSNVFIISYRHQHNLQTGGQFNQLETNITTEKWNGEVFASPRWFFFLILLPFQNYHTSSSTYMSGTKKPCEGRADSTVVTDMIVTDISSATGIQGKLTHTVDWTWKNLGSVLSCLRVKTWDVVTKLCSICHSSGSSNVHTSQVCDLLGSGRLTVQDLRWYVSISSRISCSMETSKTSSNGPDWVETSENLFPMLRGLGYPSVSPHSHHHQSCVLKHFSVYYKK
jgi:hypothetical protein